MDARCQPKVQKLVSSPERPREHAWGNSGLKGSDRRDQFTYAVYAGIICRMCTNDASVRLATFFGSHLVFAGEAMLRYQ